VAQRRAPDGSLAIWAGSIGVHVMKAAFLERMAAQTGGLPFHRARKKVPHIDEAGRQVQPASPNAIKFERFIFDLLPSARNAIGVEVDPQHSFAPLKNASGEKADTPETVRAQMVALHTEWLRQAGVEVAEGVPVEISPLFALDPDELRAKLTRADRIASPRFFSAKG
jgi:UDP-N-acetylglucosamine/UDP-N-acetylgalactosamine diphosphorylase